MASIQMPISDGAVFKLDGRTLEGGGQLIRLALGLSALKSQSLEISHVRGNRSGGGGLKAQHLACVRWLAEACDAETQGASIKSREFTFRPKITSVVPTNYKEMRQKDGTRGFETLVDIGSPGSVALALQAVLPFILFRPPVAQSSSSGEGRTVVRLTIKGGTNVSNSPSFEYLDQVFLPTLSLIGLPAIRTRLERRGWSTGESTIGTVSFKIPTLRPGEKLSCVGLQSLEGIAVADRHASDIEATVIAPLDLHERFEECLHAILERQFGKATKIKVHAEDSQHEKRIYLIIVARVRSKDREFRFGKDELFRGRLSREYKSVAEDMTERVVKQLGEDLQSGACVDGHLVDQLVVFQCLADGKSNVWRGVSERQSLHAETAEWICGEMVGGVLSKGRGRGVGFVAGKRAESTQTTDGEREVVKGVQRMGLK